MKSIKNKTFPLENNHIEYKEYVWTDTHKIYNDYKYTGKRLNISIDTSTTSKKDKSTIKIPNRLKKEICAFLNNNIQNGINKSYIYIGVNDIDRQLKWNYTYNDRKLFQQTVENWLSSCFFPEASPYVHINIDNNPISLIIQSPSNIVFFTKPTSKKGWQICIRVGTSLQVAQPEIMYRLISESNIYNYDNSNFCGNFPLHFSHLYRKFKDIGLNFNLRTNKGFYTASGKFTNTAFFFSDECPITTILTLHNGTSIDSHSHSISPFKGPLFKQIDDINKYINNYININNLNKCYPKKAIKEALVNAFAHRSYLYYKQEDIQINIYPNRIEILSPGWLPGGLSKSNALSGESFIRNHSIFYLLHILGYAHRTGSGFILMKTCYNTLSKRTANINITLHRGRISSLKSGTFVLTLPNIIYNHANNPKENDIKKIANNNLNNLNLNINLNSKEKIMNYLHTHTRITHNIIEQICHVKTAQASRLINSLRTDNLIKRHGLGIYTYYTES